MTLLSLQCHLARDDYIPLQTCVLCGYGPCRQMDLLTPSTERMPEVPNRLKGVAINSEGDAI